MKSLENMKTITIDFYYKLKNYFHNFLIGVKNLYHYFPIIWGERQFDQLFIDKLIQFKLKMLLRYWSDEKNMIVESWGETRDEISEVLYRFDRIIESDSDFFLSLACPEYDPALDYTYSFDENYKIKKIKSNHPDAYSDEQSSYYLKTRFIFESEYRRETYKLLEKYSNTWWD